MAKFSAVLIVCQPKSLRELFLVRCLHHAAKSPPLRAMLSSSTHRTNTAMPSISKTWGTEPQERRRAFPCDGIIFQPDDALYRGITINAAPETIFRWLCQMRAAPYSYDFVDNGGRRSPRELTPGLEQLAPGQDVMRIFDLVAFEQDRQLTIRVKARSSASRTFGDIAGSYVIVPGPRNRCRLLVKLIAKYPRGIKGRLMRALLPWGDLIMMRRQLLNFKRLAEETKDLGSGLV